MGALNTHAVYACNSREVMLDVNLIRDQFELHYGIHPRLIVRAPGRINLIGEHTDYNDGFVFPAAIDRSLYVAARVTGGPSELISVQMGPAKPFEAKGVEPGELDDWAKYAAGMAWVLRGQSSSSPGSTPFASNGFA